MSYRAVAAAVAATLGCPIATATTYPTYPIAPGNAVNTTQWVVDRYPPQAFVNAGTQFLRDDVLRTDVSAADGPTVRPAPFTSSFYNTQGRVVGTLGNGPGTAVSGSLYIPASWGTSTVGSSVQNRTGTLLLELSPFAAFDPCPTGDGCVVYAAIGFTNADPNDPLGGGGIPRIRILDKETSVVGWVNLATPFQTNAWNDFCIAYDGASLSYFANGTLIYTDNTVVQPSPIPTPIQGIRKTFIQTYNYGTDYSAFWSRLEHGARANLTLSVSAPVNAVAGGTLPVTYTISNAGPQAATQVQLPLTLAGATLMSVSGACSSAACVIPTIAAATSAVVTATYQITAPIGGTIGGQPRLQTTSVDCTPADNSVSLNVLVGAPIQPAPVPTVGWFGLLALLTGVLVATGFTLRRR